LLAMLFYTTLIATLAATSAQLPHDDWEARVLSAYSAEEWEPQDRFLSEGSYADGSYADGSYDDPVVGDPATKAPTKPPTKAPTKDPAKDPATKAPTKPPTKALTKDPVVIKEQSVNGEITWSGVSWPSCPKGFVASVKTTIAGEFKTEAAKVINIDCSTVPSPSPRLRTRRLADTYDVTIKYGVVVNTQVELDNALAKQNELSSDTTGTGALKQFTDALVKNDVSLSALSSAKATAGVPFVGGVVIDDTLVDVKKDDGLSGGEIAGIVIGSLVGVGLLMLVAMSKGFYCLPICSLDDKDKVSNGKNDALGTAYTGTEVVQQVDVEGGLRQTATA